MRKLTVEMLESGAGEGDGSSDTGISKSVLPTLKGPVYEGNPGVGLSCERKDTMVRGGYDCWMCYGSTIQTAASCTLILGDCAMTT